MKRLQCHQLGELYYICISRDENGILAIAILFYRQAFCRDKKWIILQQKREYSLEPVQYHASFFKFSFHENYCLAIVELMEGHDNFLHGILSITHADLCGCFGFIVYVIYRIFSCVPIKVFVIEKIRVFNGKYNFN